MRTVKGEPEINQTYVAKISGTNQPNVSRWIRGKFLPSLEELQKLSEAFGVNTSQMLGELPIERIDYIKHTNRDKEFFEFYSTMPDKVKEYVFDTAKSANKYFPEGD